MNTRQIIVETIDILKPGLAPGHHTVKNLQLMIRAAETNLEHMLRRIDTPVEIVACGNCDYEGRADKHSFLEVDEFKERVSEGETVPYGQCPKCHALLHAKD